jgi:Uncharacterized protein containing a NRPS condensation (elongation) domain
MINKWIKLDNAAKIFPSAVSKSNTLVFRFSCELLEPVDAIILQEALDRTVDEFDVFQYVLRRGLFWYYFETTTLRPAVREEYKSPCSPLYDRGVRALLYEVTYYRTRINFEIYHALTDGTGALHFMELLVIKYLSLAHSRPEPTTYYDASQAQMGDDSFERFSSSERIKRNKPENGYQLRGARYAENRLSVIRGTMELSSALQAAHRCSATLTALLCGALMNAIGTTMPVRAKHKPVVIAVPVNLRKYFPSVSARNFFAIVFVKRSFDPVNLPTIEETAAQFGADLTAQLNTENLTADINAHAVAERNLFARITPLPLKDFILRRAYMLSQRRATATLSNVGSVKLPTELEKYVRSFSVCNGTNKIQACVCSFAGRLCVEFTSPFVSSDVQRVFFRTLTQLGIEVEISANRLE